MSRFRSPALKRSQSLLAAIILLASLALYFVLIPASGADIESQALQLGKSTPGATTSYFLSFNTNTSGALGSVRADFCSNSPLINRPCTPPVGFDISQATLVNQSGPGGFSISNATTANSLVLTRTPSPVAVGIVTFELEGVVNPSSIGTSYGRVYTYATNNATGSASDSGGLAFSITAEVTITAEVPPFLVFCTGITITGLNCETASGDYIDFGELSSKKAGSGSSKMLVATNAVDGYTITLAGTTLSSGNNSITPLFTGDVSRPGVSQFGLNLRSNSTPAGGSNPSGPGVGSPKPGYNQPNTFRFVNGEIAASSAVPDDKRLYTASYMVNVPATQPPGIYVSTVTYVCLANF